MGYVRLRAGRQNFVLQWRKRTQAKSFESLCKITFNFFFKIFFFYLVIGFCSVYVCMCFGSHGIFWEPMKSSPFEFLTEDPSKWRFWTILIFYLLIFHMGNLWMYLLISIYIYTHTPSGYSLFFPFMKDNVCPIAYYALFWQILQRERKLLSVDQNNAKLLQRQIN